MLIKALEHRMPDLAREIVANHARLGLSYLVDSLRELRDRGEPPKG